MRSKIRSKVQSIKETCANKEANSSPMSVIIAPKAKVRVLFRTCKCFTGKIKRKVALDVALTYLAK